jgi:hypothetical protein
MTQHLPRQKPQKNLLWNGALTLFAQRWSLESHNTAPSSKAAVTASPHSWCCTKMRPYDPRLASHQTQDTELIFPPPRNIQAKSLFHFYQKQNKTKKLHPTTLPQQSIEFKPLTEEAKDFLISSKKCQLCPPTGFQPWRVRAPGCHTNLPADLQFNSLLCTAPDTVQQFRSKLPPQGDPPLSSPWSIPWPPKQTQKQRQSRIWAKD